MCQMRVVLSRNGTEEALTENLSRLDVVPEGITLTALFEEPLFLAGATVRSIDFLQGVVTIDKTEEA